MKKIITILLLILSLKSFGQKDTSNPYRGLTTGRSVSIIGDISEYVRKCNHIYIAIAHEGEMKDTVVNTGSLITYSTTYAIGFSGSSDYTTKTKYVCVRCYNIKEQTVITKLK